MLNLRDRQWAEFRVGDLFSVITGKAYNKNKMNLSENGLRHISRATFNHGIDCYASMDDYDDYIKYEGNCITVSSIPYQKDGTCAFYQDKEFCCGVGVNILNSDWLNSHNALFICNCINNAVVGKYGMARSLGASMLKEEILLLPVNNAGQPDYEFMEQYIREREPDYSWATECIEPNAEISLSDREWAEFKISDLFKVSGTKTTKTGIKESGKYPYLTTQATNNSVNGYTDFATEKGNCIVAESACIGYSSYQETDFTASDHVEKLTPYSQSFNKFIGLFINTMLRKATEGKYNYGYKFNQGRIRETIILLPVTPDGQPDYDFMEQYIKSLPFSKAIE